MPSTPWQAEDTRGCWVTAELLCLFELPVRSADHRVENLSAPFPPPTVTPCRCEESDLHPSTFIRYLHPKEKRATSRPAEGEGEKESPQRCFLGQGDIMLPFICCKPPEMVFSMLLSNWSPRTNLKAARR